MEDSGGVDRIAQLARYFFRCPPAQHVLTIMIVAALLFPISGSDIFSKTGFFIFLFVPAILTSIFSWKVVEKMGGVFKDSYSYFLSTVSMIAIAALLAVVSLTERFYTFQTWNSVQILFVGLAAIFVLHLLVYAAVGGLSIYKSAIPSSLYLIFSGVIMYFLGAVSLRIFGRFALLLLASFSIVWLFIKLTDAPFKRTLGVATFDLISLAISEYVDPTKISRNPFKSVGRIVNVPNQAVKFETKNNKYLLTVPWLHPGPVESIGGKLPSELLNALKKRYSNSVFAHTYVDHSLNPIFLSQTVEKISASLKSKNYFSEKIAKCTKFLSLKINGVSLVCQKFGKTYFFVTSFAPKVTEDITSSVGFSLLEKFSNNAIFVDAHNSFSPEDDEVESIGWGDKRVTNLLSAIDSAKKKLDTEKQCPFKFSLVSSAKTFLDHGIKGIRFLAFEISKQKVALVVLDANNFVPEFRAEIIKKLSALGFNIAEVLTTDTHIGDLVIKIYGQIGRSGKEVLAEEIVSLGKEALKKLDYSKMSYGFSNISVKVFGEKTFHQMIATAHSLIPFAQFLTLSLFVAFLFAAYVIFQLPLF